MGIDPDRAWAAGLFDGEGWVGPTERGVQARINQAGAGGVPEVLVRFQRAVGCGRIGGPDRKPGRLDLYRWSASSRRDVEAVLTAIGPWLGAVKRAQFARAIGERPCDPTPPVEDVTWRAWAAGFWDGEGCVSLGDHRTRPGRRTIEACLTQEGGPEGSEILVRLRAALGRGHLNGPYAQIGATRPVYRLRTSRIEDVRAIVHSLLPWLGSVKRRQALLALRTVDAQPDLPRGNPAWGRAKSHCPYGHELASARIRPYRSRSAPTERPRPHRGCLRCLRERAASKKDGSRPAPSSFARSRRYLLK